MSRVTQAALRGLTRPTVLSSAALAIFLVTSLLCLASPHLCVCAVLGIGLGIIVFWNISVWVKFFLICPLVLVTIVGCRPDDHLPFDWTVPYQVHISLGSSNGITWTIDEEMTIPGATLRQITEGTGLWWTPLPPPKPQQYQMDTDRLTKLLRSSGWKFLGVENGENPVYQLKLPTRSYPQPLMPLVATHEVDLTYATLDDEFGIAIGPSSASYVIVSAPSGIIAATTPASSAETTTSGQERTIEASSFGELDQDSSGKVRISTLSVLARNAPGQVAAEISLSNMIPWAMGGVWVLLFALMRNEGPKALKSVFQRIHKRGKRTKKDRAANQGTSGKSENKITLTAAQLPERRSSPFARKLSLLLFTPVIAWLLTRLRRSKKSSV